MSEPSLSKSRFISGSQCHLKLWYDTYERDLASGVGYDDLEIAEGTMASVQYTLALANEDHEERERTFANLRAYCERDTYAMVRLREALGAI